MAAVRRAKNVLDVKNERKWMLDFFYILRRVREYMNYRDTM